MNTIVVLILATVVFVGLSWIGEPGRVRWGKIAVSLALVWLLAPVWKRRELSHDLIFSVFLFYFLCRIWSNEGASFLSRCFVDGFLFSWNRGGGGFRTDLRAAHSAFNEGDLEDARRFLAEELEKDPLSVEGLMLLAGIEREHDRLDRAIAALNRILAQEDVDERQKSLARQEKDQCEYLKRYREITGDSR